MRKTPPAPESGRIDVDRPLKIGLMHGEIDHVAVIGAGLFGCELAEAFRSLWGAEVTLIEAAATPLPEVLDPELGAVVQKHMEIPGPALPPVPGLLWIETAGARRQRRLDASQYRELVTTRTGWRNTAWAGLLAYERVFRLYQLQAALPGGLYIAGLTRIGIGARSVVPQ